MTGGILNLLAAVAASAVVLAAFALMAVRRRTPAPHPEPEPEEAPILNPLASLGWSMRPTLFVDGEDKQGGRIFYFQRWECRQEPRLTKTVRGGSGGHVETWAVDGQPRASLNEALDCLGPVMARRQYAL